MISPKLGPSRYLLALVFVSALLLPSGVEFARLTGLLNRDNRGVSQIIADGARTVRRTGRWRQLLDIDQMRKWSESTQKRFGERYAGRDYLLRLMSLLKFRGFRVSPIPDSVIIGREGWLFLGDSHGDVLRESLGLERFHSDELQKIAKNLADRRAWLAKQGIKYYVAVAPNKHTLYPEYLPKRYDHFRGESKFDQLKKYLRSSSDFELIDMKVEMLAVKTQERLFGRSDTHWNDLGALLAARTLLHRIQVDFPSIEVRKREDFVEETVIIVPDLIRMLQLDDRHEKRSLRLRGKNGSSAPVISENGGHRPYKSRIFNRDATSGLKVLLFRDSFGIGLVPFVRESFDELLIVFQHDLDKDLVKEEKPDIVITELVERNIDFLMP